MRPIGFSTGAIARHDFERGLSELRRLGVRVVELSSLRFDELEPLARSLSHLDLEDFDFVSFHAPSQINPADEAFVADTLHGVAALDIPIVVHPDIIFTPDRWRGFGNKLLIENMDKRKPIGRTASELDRIFEPFPEARFCFDLGHARQVDATMLEAQFILSRLGPRLAEVHISEVNTASRHEPLSYYARTAFQSVAMLIPEDTPIILETLIDSGQSDIETEIERAREALPVKGLVPAGR